MTNQELTMETLFKLSLSTVAPR